MARITGGRSTSAHLVGIAAARIEEQLLKRRMGGYGVDLDTDPEDSTKTDIVLALAAQKLLKKYGDRLTVCRYRHRITIAWRADAFAVVQKKVNRDALNSIGFYGNATLSVEELRSGVDPGEVGHPDDPHVQRRVAAARRHRVATWTAQGWHGDSAWGDAGGSPAQVEQLREQLRSLVRDGKVNIGGVEVQWQEPKIIVTP